MALMITLFRPRRRLLTLVTLLLLTAAPLHAATVTALWDPNPEPEVTGYRLSYGTAPGVYTTTIDVGKVTSWVLTVPDGPRYYFVLVAYTATAVSPFSPEVVLDLSVPLPSPWIAQDIGSPTVAGSTTLTAGVFTVLGAGRDIWDASDQFQFVSQPLTGDGTITARVTSLINTDSWAKAGVMIREDGTAGAPNALAYVSGGQGLIFSQRIARSGLTTSSSATVVPGVAPYWVRLARTGNTFTAFRSVDGIAWILLGTTTMPMAASASVGLAVTSDVPTVTTTAVFSQVSLTTAVGLGPPLPPTGVAPRKP
jgi:regulation of enolase protein 1 (concanavalin A-like superfamily)